MATDAQIAANRRNAKKSTGPRSTEGKARVARNSATFGLFARNDHTPTATKEADIAMSAALFEQLAPVGPLEESLAAEILRACRRLDRCARADYRIASDENYGAADVRYIGVDRARVAAERSRDRAIAQLRRLQTERALRETYTEGDLPVVSGLAEQRELLRGIPGNRVWQVLTGTTSDYDHERLMRRDIQECERDLAQLRLNEQVCSNLLRSGVDPKLTSDSNSANQTQSPKSQLDATSSDKAPVHSPAAAGRSDEDEIPRSAPCPCGSTLKYKRCCGRAAPGILGVAA